MLEEYIRVSEEIKITSDKIEDFFAKCNGFVTVKTKAGKKRNAKMKDNKEGGEGVEGNGSTLPETSPTEKEKEKEVIENLELLKTCLDKTKVLLDCLQKSSESQAAQMDDVKQRQLKGNFLLTSKKTDDKESVILTDEILSSKSVKLESHVNELLKAKYNIEIPIEDIQACHRLKSKDTILLKIWNRRSDSAYWKLIDAMKSGGVNKNINFYVNHQLTPERNQLVYNVRKLKETKVIDKYYINENGNVYIKVKPDGRKIKVTQVTTANKNYIHNPDADELQVIIAKEKSKMDN